MLDLKQPWVKVATVIVVAVVLMASGGIQSAYNLIENSGTLLAKRQILNFLGSGVSCADAAPLTNCTINGTGIANYSQSFTSQTSVTLTDNLGTTAKLTECFDGSNNLITPATITITDANDVTVTFSTSQTGRCVVNGAASGGIQWSFGGTFVNGGNPLVAGATTYFTITHACTIVAWNITIVPADTATFDIWDVATGTAVPTVANTIISTGPPAISTGTAVHSTTVTGWTAGNGTSVLKNYIFGINLKAVGGTATQATLNVECDQ
jgi:hypothetical protein